MIEQSFVIATAGHVDHGKSALVRALTGTEPDRWTEERERGLTIDLGFAELTLASGRTVSFVDVPGHERFIGNMLAGLGPAPVVCLVVAADEGWQAQTAEHRDAINALGIAHGIVVISRADLAPERVPTVAAQIRHELSGTALHDAPIVATSAVAGTGLDTFLTELDTLLAGLPPADTTAPIRYWVDRSFTVKGAGTVVTGTLAAGTLHLEDRLEVAGRDTAGTIRQLQSHGTSTTVLSPVTRAAVNLRGVTTQDIGRGDALVTPDAWQLTDTLDVAGTPGVDFTALAQQFSVHIGSATATAHCRPLGPHFARLTIDRQLPLHIGDRLMLRGTGPRLITGGATVLDVDPPVLQRRGAARRRTETLQQLTAANHLHTELLRRGAIRQATTTAMGLPIPVQLPAEILTHKDWYVDRTTLEGWTARLREAVAQHYTADPSAGGIPQQAAVHLLALPDAALLSLVVARAELQTGAGRVTDPTLRPTLGTAEPAIAALERHFAAEPFTAPTTDQLAALGLDTKALAAAAQQDRLLRLADTTVLGPKAPAMAMRELVKLDQPFTAADARQALGTTRRTLIPLLEYLDERGWTHRVDGSLRRVAGR